MSSVPVLDLLPGHLTVDFTYQYSLTEERTIKNSADSTSTAPATSMANGPATAMLW